MGISCIKKFKNTKTTQYPEQGYQVGNRACLQQPSRLSPLNCWDASFSHKPIVPCPFSSFLAPVSNKTITHISKHIYSLSIWKAKKNPKFSNNLIFPWEFNKGKTIFLVCTNIMILNNKYKYTKQICIQSSQLTERN